MIGVPSIMIVCGLGFDLVTLEAATGVGSINPALDAAEEREIEAATTHPKISKRTWQTIQKQWSRLRPLISSHRGQEARGDRETRRVHAPEAPDT